jgi:hypothetical protein
MRYMTQVTLGLCCQAALARHKPAIKKRASGREAHWATEMDVIAYALSHSPGSEYADRTVVAN